MRFTDTLFRICWAAPSEDPWEVADFARTAIASSRASSPGRPLGVDLLQSADVFHIIGGGYVNTHWPRHLALLAAGGRARRRVRDARRADRRRPRPQPGGARAARPSWSPTSRSLDVRDEPSRELFGSDRVTNTGDDVLLNLGDHLYDERESRSVMLSRPVDLATKGIAAICETVLGTLEAWGVEGEQIGYVEAMPGRDTTAASST